MLRYGECGKEDYVVFGSQMRLRRVLRVPFVLLRHTSNDSFRRVLEWNWKVLASRLLHYKDFLLWETMSRVFIED
jgi:hypothetical protein